MFFFCFLIVLLGNFVIAEEGLGCGGFIISHVEIDYTKIEVELYTKDGIWKDKTSCAPSSGYYFIPIYDIGDFILQLVPPAGWSLTPNVVQVSIDGISDLCSKGEDINFVFKGFGITGIVESYGTAGMGPEGVTVELKSDLEIRKVVTKQNGTFFFTPVYPGHYTISISHKLWRILKQSVIVNVNEGNTELPLASLVISGYDVTGYIKNDSELLDGISIVIFQDQDNENIPHVDGCNKTVIKDLKQKRKQLCHISSSVRGNFTFDVVSPGYYFIIPYYRGQHIHFQPEIIKFQVGHASVLLSEPFKIIGFSVFGFVLTSKNGNPLKGANVFLNGNMVTTTKEDGSYTLENIKADFYKISVTADDVMFETITLKINQHILQISDFVPSLYKVCGNVVSEQAHNVLITDTGSSQTFITNSALPDGKFCIHLSHGKYSMQVVLNETEISHGIQFFPTFYDFEINDSSLMGISFSQLKARVSGKVICNNQKDCNGLNVILRLLLNQSPAEDKVNIVPLLDNGTYIFEKVRQGNYEVSLAPNKFCWKKTSRPITVSSTNEAIAPFIQSGFLVVFISSHASKVTYKLNQDEKSVDIKKGKTAMCLDNPGAYEFTLTSCHVYERRLIYHNTNSKEYEIHISALKHTVVIEIECEENYGELYMIIELDGVQKQEGPLEFKDKGYFLGLMLKPNDLVILAPRSEVLFVYPLTLSINGQNDCINLGVQFHAKKGRIFEGNIIPPLEGVLITVETDTSVILSNKTNVDGKYKFPPQDNAKQYKVIAKKDSYVLFGPDDHGNFIAHKLAEIAVNVVFDDNNEPLQGVLLSLSGSQGYRKNIPTGKDGVVAFHSLTPGEYFLKPMKKEYSFDPSTKLIVAEEGITIPIILKGKRFAYSGYGQVTSLNGDAVERVTILASGLGNCSRLFEESTSEQNGQFHIRGLHPYCTYNIQVKHTVEEKHIKRGLPSINISVLESDVHGLKFTVFKSMHNTDVLVRLYCKNSDIYKALRISLSRESNPSGLIHTTKLENHKLTKNNAGILVYLPTLLLDGKTYYVQVESGSSDVTTINGDIYYFTANTSFNYIDLDCNSQKGSPVQNIKQTSLWTLLIIFITLLGFYNIEYTVQIAKEQFSKLNFGHILNRLRPLPITAEFVIDKNEINQIMESINSSKHKLKPRKI